MSNSSFQSEIDKARVAVHFIVRPSDADNRVALPPNMEIAGDNRNGWEPRPLRGRETININFNSVIDDSEPADSLSVASTLPVDVAEEGGNLRFRDMKDAEPEQVPRYIPQSEAMLSMRSLLRAPEVRQPDNVAFHNALEKIPEPVKTATSFMSIPGTNTPPRISQADRPFCSHFRFC
ncbi:type VI secretion system contractile sheath small subunit [Pantoea sp. GD03673]|uniref:type VI secretion system contractile sheath small subunit n=1 Tax=Pantoea sp. GD03673 TaxID=2975364 RepID=UPI002449F8CE|nr:type VI secretion system contractile sheath small subunit [Pantoea sp. GD03673]MDH2066575.1 type VI secretion system contractile sheath small subunit [Pantoea sp. GD03673]